MIKEIQIPFPEKVFTKVYTKLSKADSRFVINYGGTGSGKSFSAAQKEVLIAVTQKNITIAVFRKVASTLKKSVYRSFKRRITEFDLWDIFTENKTEMTFTCTQTGSEIWFLGLDDAEKIKSIEGVDRIMIEEASEIEFDDFLELNRRARGKPNIQITLCFNPIHETHWLKTHFFDKELPNITKIKSTYLDNPFLTEKDKEQIEQLRQFNYNQYRIYALGDWGLTENNAPWLYNFDEQKHVKAVDFLPGYPVYISFDFNVDPFACTIWQMSPQKGTKDSFVHCIDEINGKLKVEEMCDIIATKYPASIKFITGDRSGQNEDIGRNQSLYQMIGDRLGVSDKCLNLNTSNLEHGDSRLLCNSMLMYYPNMFIHPRCKVLIDDCKKATIDDKSNKPSQLKKDREMYKMDSFDSMRYFYQTYFLTFVKDTYMKFVKK